jgi:P27 family predicted phage terminase small subunit
MAEKPKVPPAPAGLSVESVNLWKRLATDVIGIEGGCLSDWLVLEGMLRARDRQAEVRARIDTDGVTVEGSQGQLRPHPLLAVEATLARDIAAGLDRLGLARRYPAKDFEITAAGRLRRPARWYW